MKPEPVVLVNKAWNPKAMDVRRARTYIKEKMNQDRRNKFFSNVDAGALDINGRQILFGDDYLDDEGILHNVCGLDLRARNGWVFTWNCSTEKYDCVQAVKLTRAFKCDSCEKSFHSSQLKMLSGKQTDGTEADVDLCPRCRGDDNV